MPPPSIIIRKDLTLSLHGFSDIAEKDAWAKTGVPLMNRLWEVVRALGLPNKGVNVWVYEEGKILFTGVELDSPPPAASALEEKTINISRYATCKHVGPYDGISATYAAGYQELKNIGLHPMLPYLEIYGNHHDDPAQLETDLIWTIK